MKSLAQLNKYFIKYRWRFLLGIVFVIAQNFFAVYQVQWFGKSLDTVVSSMSNYQLHPLNKDLLVKDVTDTIFIFLLVIIGLGILRGIIMFMMRQTMIVMSRLIEYDLKNDIYEHYQKLSLAFYRRNNTGDLVNRISEDVSRVRMYIGPAIMYTINLVVLFTLIIIIMFSVNTKLAFYVLLPLPFLSISIYLVSDRMNRKSEDVQEQQSRLSTFVQEAFSGIRVLKSFVKETQSADVFENESMQYKNKSMELVKINSMFFPLMLLLVGLSTLLVVYIGGKEVIAGNITTGNIVEFIIYVNMLTWPVAALGWVTAIVQRAAASQVRINEFLHTEPEIVSNEENRVEVKGKIEFRNVCFVYPESGTRALDNVSFVVYPGQSLAVLGKTGSGKSTLANLVVRMYDVGSGKILIDDDNIENISLTTLRDNIGYVQQDVFLFSDTIANNISFGINSRNRAMAQSPQGSANVENQYPNGQGSQSTFNGEEQGSQSYRRDVEQAAKDAVIYDNIMEFEKNFGTLIGERGITLSGGQKQRVSIARALIKNPKILLFDDCLSAVDTQTEEHILNNLKIQMRGRTSIIISHRVSTVKNADHIIVLDGGKVVETGTHDDLINKGTLYFQLYEKQLMEEAS
ncbi:MAG: ABC transporter ATP-binding protein [Bacteroidota bacterium]